MAKVNRGHSDRQAFTKNIVEKLGLFVLFVSIEKLKFPVWLSHEYELILGCQLNKIICKIYINNYSLLRENHWPFKFERG